MALVVLSTLSTLAPFTVSRGLAHEIQPVVADVKVGSDRVDITMFIELELLAAGLDLSEITNTRESPLVDAYDVLRALEPADMQDAFIRAWPRLKPDFTARAGETDLDLEIVSIFVPEVGDVLTLRESVLSLSAELPPDGTPVVFGWSEMFGPLVVRQVPADGSEPAEDASTAYLVDGALTEPMERDNVGSVGAFAFFGQYTWLGVIHIVPRGLDHILFVLGLFFFSLRMGPLLWQVTTFTLAHTITLALATLDIVSVPASVVEPLIAASIVVVAVENIRGGKIGWERIAVVFVFGLLHGLGFASVLGDIGFQAGRLAIGLIGFNIGVELGQLAVIAVAYVLLAVPFGKRPWYRRVIAVPASVAIGLIGTYWVLERTGLLEMAGLA